MYTDLAHLWPLISDPSNYAEEAAFWREVVRKKLGPGRHHVLELGVGGGNNLSHLTADFDATAVDLSEGMLAHSRKLNPGVEHHVGDMRTVRMGRTFNAVLIHDAISYLISEDDIRATMETATAHLESGGVFVGAPDFFRETFTDSKICHDRASDGKIELTHIEYTYDPDPADTTYETVMFYLIREGKRLTVEQESHLFGLFSVDRWLSLMEEAGFDAETAEYPVHEDGHPGYLLVGVKR